MRSEKKSAPYLWASSETNFIGLITPVSLLTCMTATSATSSEIISANASRLIIPFCRTGISSTTKPFSSAPRYADSKTALCSVEATKIRFLPRKTVGNTPLIPRLIASVDPEVKMMDAARAPTKSATCPRAISIFSNAAIPKACWALEALPKLWENRGIMTSSTSGSTGVVALKSR